MKIFQKFFHSFVQNHIGDICTREFLDWNNLRNFQFADQTTQNPKGIFFLIFFQFFLNDTSRKRTSSKERSLPWYY